MGTARPRCAALAFVALAVVPQACTGPDAPEASPRPRVSPATASPAAPVDARPDAPSWRGRLDVVLLGGTSLISPLQCEPEPRQRRVCSVEGDAYVTSGEPRPARLVAAVTDLDAGHLSWTTSLRFAPGSRASLLDARDAARRAGGQLLLQEPGGPVLLAVPLPDVSGRTLRLGGLEKPEAWGYVEQLTGLVAGAGSR